MMEKLGLGLIMFEFRRSMKEFAQTQVTLLDEF